ncbi:MULTISPECIES: aldehyde dehydrogenase family protein [Bacillaceae]|uniref:3-sulfolactaldehyde dehydrogenase n=1 Tax=Lentibacillus amyloliquefaciens TaxID=1472767 RepID=A0A0U4F9L3_9BACI|nr:MULTISPECIES: aldehyde dehydrogenase family protein [Bacillaceae]ALX49507.1 aldehyde dehydrogenase [Lentibacillus amyloliquefaciens]
MDRDFSNLYISGEWRKGRSNRTLEDINPYNEELILEIQAGNSDDLNDAYESSQSAQKDWAATLPQFKQQIFEKAANLMTENQEEIIRWLVNESGSTRIKAMVEFQAAYNDIREASTFPLRMNGVITPSKTEGKENRVYREPLGVVGVISPWNFPLHLTMRSVAAALATGNGVVVKPATDTPVTGGLLIASLFEEAGLPGGLLNVVAGRGSEIGDDMVTHPIPRFISFTGSTEVGRHIGELAGKSLKKTALELGGNNVFIMLEDANIEDAVESAVFGKFLHQGQVCIAANRILVPASRYNEFVEAFRNKVDKLQVGDPEDPKTNVGPVINEGQLKGILKDINLSVELGAKKVMGGTTEGNILEPTILTEVTNDMPIASNEIFGPVAPIIAFKDVDEAIKIANDSPYGLSGAVHSASLENGVNVARRIHTGMVHVNDQSINDEAHVPFGGEKDSGIGRFNGDWALEEFTTTRWISVQHKKRNYGPFFS